MPLRFLQRNQSDLPLQTHREENRLMDSRRPRLLVLGRGAKRSASGPLTISRCISPIGPPPESLYQSALAATNRLPLVALQRSISLIPKALLLRMLPTLSRRLSAEFLISIEDAHPSFGPHMESQWHRLCGELGRQMREPPRKDDTEPWRHYYGRLSRLLEEREASASNSLRETYEAGRTAIHSSKLIGPRRNVNIPGENAVIQPTTNISCTSTLMKRSVTETISSRNTRSKTSTTGRMIPPKKR